MIKEYFITNNTFNLLKIEIKQTFIIIQIKIAKQFIKYYTHLLKQIYNIKPIHSTSKTYNKYYKIIILNYLLCL